MHQVDELARALRSYRDGIEYSPDRLPELEGRLDLINRLRRKYGRHHWRNPGVRREGLAGAGNAISQGGACGGIEGPRDGLRRQVGRLRVSSPKPGNTQRWAWLMRYRKRLPGWASAMPKCLWISVNQTLRTVCRLGTADGVRYATPSSGGESIRHLAFNETGIDSVEFLISLNRGEPPRPLARIASGEKPLG